MSSTLSLYHIICPLIAWDDREYYFVSRQSFRNRDVLFSHVISEIREFHTAKALLDDDWLRGYTTPSIGDDPIVKILDDQLG